jgi:hypothetical protein
MILGEFNIDVWLGLLDLWVKTLTISDLFFLVCIVTLILIIFKYFGDEIFIAIIIIVLLVFIPKKCSSDKNCEKCKGDGYVDQNDLDDLDNPTFEKNGKNYYYSPGPCSLCNKD